MRSVDAFITDTSLYTASVPYGDTKCGQRTANT